MKIKIVALVLVLALALSACGSTAPSKAAPNTAAPTAAVSAAPSANADKPQGTAEVSIKTLVELIGKKDADVVAVLGEGTPSLNEEGVIIDREYSFKLFNEDVIANLSFNMYTEGEDKLELCTLHLNNVSLDGYRDELTAVLGKPIESSERSYSYETDTTTVILANPYDLPYIEIAVKLQ